MSDFDPRDSDPRDDDRFDIDRGRGRASHDDDGENDWRQPDVRSRDRDNDARQLGRGPGSDSRQSTHDKQGDDPRDGTRWTERDGDSRERDVDPRDVFNRDLELPRGLEREIVRDRDRDREYTLRGS